MESSVVWRAETRRGFASRSAQSATSQKRAHALRARHIGGHHHSVWNQHKAMSMDAQLVNICTFYWIISVSTFKYLSSLLKNKNSIHEAIKCVLKARTSCYYPVRTLLSSRLPLRIIKLKYIKQWYCQLYYMVIEHGLLH